MLDIQQKFDLIYERLVNSVTEQEISDTWNMYSLRYSQNNLPRYSCRCESNLQQGEQ